jgi:hypothetical protein
MSVKFNHGRRTVVLWGALTLAVAAVLLHTPFSAAQSLTTGAIAGTVTDPTGAVVPNATVTVTNTGTGQVRNTTSGPDGTYTVPLLNPGQYDVKVNATGFRAAEQTPITVALSATTSLNIRLEIGQATQTVEVTGAAPLIETSNPNTTTNVNSNELASLPNPGNDLSYVAQVAPGAVMNTTGGYGNMEFNGLPATSTNFTIDGMDANDPFLNLNNSGATNLQLGLNSMQEASINTLSYSADQGRQGAAQVNFISKSGTNQIHGNLFETWNGAVMNSVDWFVNASPTGETAHRGRSNVNQFGGSIGGKILRDKLFYFFDMEGIRIVVPTTLTEGYPTAAYEQQVLNTIPVGGEDPLLSTPTQKVIYAPPPNPQAAISYYQKAFALYGHPSGGVPSPQNGCTLGSASSVAAGAGDGCVLFRVFPFSNQTHDLYWKSRVDHDINATDKVWYSFEWEKGVQATYTDPVNTVFNAYSTQPQNGAAVGWTHVFSPTLVNDFNPGYYWYSAIFKPDDLAAAKAASPFEFAGPGLSSIFGAATAWPQGRNVTDYQIIDNLTWTKSTHTFKFGGNLRRTLVSDFDLGINSIPYVSGGDIYQYAMDVTNYVQQGFPSSTSEQVRIISLDLYAMDTWKVRPNVTLTYGVRSTWNSDPLSRNSAFSNLAGNESFLSLNHDVNTPYDQIINPSRNLLAFATPLVEWQPRASVAWSVKSNTVVRVGGGVFSDIFPAGLSDSQLGNFPNNNFFTTAWNTPAPGVASTYGIPGSGNGVAGSASNDALGNLAYDQATLVAGFKAGVPGCAATNAPANCIPPTNFTTLPDGTFKYPVFYEWSAGIEQQFGTNWAVKVGYVGTHASELPYTEGPNGFQTACAGCFAPYPSSFPDARFASINQYLFGANSSYNALQTSLEKRTSHGLTLNLNYTWSHCLDTLSNEGAVTGGFNPNTSNSSITPGVPISELYGNCDYDIRNSLNGNYIYQLPSLFHGNRFLGGALNGWQISGDLFIHSGYPFSVTGGGYGAGGNGVFNGSTPGVFLAEPTGQSVYAKWAHLSSDVTPPEIQWLNPNAFQAVIDPFTGACYAGETNAGTSNVTTNDNSQTCQFTRNGRNSVFGPGYANTNFFLGKNFKISERFNFRFDVQAYNVLNHMNPAQPGTGAGIPGIPASLNNAFTINHAQLAPTGLLGSGLGGDNSVRMIALHGLLTF